MKFVNVDVDKTLHDFKIEEVFLFLITTGENQEAVPAVQMGGVHMPLVAADKTRLAQLKQVARRLVDEGGVTIRLCRYSHREELEVFSPKSQNG